MPTLSGDTQAVLALDKVVFQGQEVAAVVAEDPYVAIDALELIDVDYDPPPPVIDPHKALEPGAPSLDLDLKALAGGLRWTGAQLNEGPFMRLEKKAGLCKAAMEHYDPALMRPAWVLNRPLKFR